MDKIKQNFTAKLTDSKSFIDKNEQPILGRDKLSFPPINNDLIYTPEDEPRYKRNFINSIEMKPTDVKRHIWGNIF